jgi:hypothetical protein
MADDDLSAFVDEYYEPEAQLAGALVDKKPEGEVVPEKGEVVPEKGEEVPEGEAVPESKVVLEAEVLSEPAKDKARQEALVHTADLPAREASKWSKNILISGTADIEVLGKSVAERVHKVSPIVFRCSLMAGILLAPEGHTRPDSIPYFPPPPAPTFFVAMTILLLPGLF